MTQKPVPEDRLLSDKLPMIIRESKWFLFGVLSIFLFLILFSYTPTDPSWSHQTSISVVRNLGGRVGACLADLLLYAFGIGAYCFPILCACFIFRSFRYRNNHIVHEQWWRIAGFILMMISLTAFAALKMKGLLPVYPQGTGGIIGGSIARLLHSLVGPIVSFLLLLLGIGIGFSLLTRISWLDISECLGLVVERAFLKLKEACHTHQDKRAARMAQHSREEACMQAPPEEIDAPEIPVLTYPSELQIVEPSFEPQAASANAAVQPLKRSGAPIFAAPPPGALPTLTLLHKPQEQDPSITPESLEFTSRLIERKLADFGVKVTVTAAYPGPVITRYEIEPDTGVKGAQIVSLMRDLARALCVVSIRIIETIPEKSCMGLEVPNPRRQMVSLAEILGSDVYHATHSPLTVAFGKDISGRPVVQDLAKMPHLLVAGTTGSGKSVGINAMILSLVYKSTPDQVRLILIDPKMLELSIYDGIPHLLAPVVTDMKQAANALTWCVAEMERRYRQLSSVGVRNLHGYNSRVREAIENGQPLYNKFSLTPEDPEPLSEMPHIVIIIDELADLMMVAGKKIEELIARLAQKARAAGIHLILATQRPSVDVITGLIKANIPARMAFQLPTKIDSKTILDQMGAESLLGQGDMLFLPPGTGYPIRVHGAFVDDEEVRNVADFLRQTGEPDYVEGILEAAADSTEGASSADNKGGENDPMYDEAVAIVIKTRRASISLVQRQLRIGYNRAARLIEQMEASGLVSPMQHNGTREVLAPPNASD